MTKEEVLRKREGALFFTAPVDWQDILFVSIWEITIPFYDEGMHGGFRVWPKKFGKCKRSPQLMSSRGDELM